MKENKDRFCMFVIFDSSKIPAQTRSPKKVFEEDLLSDMGKAFLIHSCGIQSPYVVELPHGYNWQENEEEKLVAVTVKAIVEENEKFRKIIELERRTHWVMADKLERYTSIEIFGEGYTPTDYVCDSRREAKMLIEEETKQINAIALSEKETPND